MRLPASDGRDARARVSMAAPRPRQITDMCQREDAAQAERHQSVSGWRNLVVCRRHSHSFPAGRRQHALAIATGCTHLGIMQFRTSSDHVPVSAMMPVEALRARRSVWSFVDRPHVTRADVRVGHEGMTQHMSECIRALRTPASSPAVSAGESRRAGRSGHRACCAGSARRPGAAGAREVFRPLPGVRRRVLAETIRRASIFRRLSSWSRCGSPSHGSVTWVADSARTRWGSFSGPRAPAWR